MDASVQLTLNQQIDSLKKKGALLAKKLEQEKHKHVGVVGCSLSSRR